MARRPTVLQTDTHVADAPDDISEALETSVETTETPDITEERTHTLRINHVSYKKEQSDGIRYILKTISPETRQEITLFCTAPFKIEKNDTLEVVGNIVDETDRNGYQVQKIDAELVTQKMEFTASAIRKWLEKHVPSVGPATAARIVESLGGNRAVDKFKNKDLMIAAGISDAIATEIYKAFADNEMSVRNYMFLSSFNIDGKQILDKRQINNIISQRFKGQGNILQKVIKANPWILMEIPSIGFKTADLVGLNMGFGFESEMRIHAGCVYALQTVGRENGHTAIPEELMVEAAASEDILGINPEKIQDKIADMLENDILIKDDSNLLYSPEMWEAEEKIANKILNMLSKKPFMTREEAEELTEKTSRIEGLKLDDSQKEAVIKGLIYPCLSLTGGPGTGKSTVQKVLFKALSSPESNREQRYEEAISSGAQYSGMDLGTFSEDYQRVTASCPTGKGAVRLSEASGFSAMTVHRTLEYSKRVGGFQRNARSPLNTPVGAIDETSMLGTSIAADYCDAMPDAAGILAVGDIQQLLSVEPGQVYKDIIMSGIMPTSVLDTTHRQSKKSGIPIASSRIMAGLFPYQENEELRGFSHVNVDDSMSMGEVLKLISDDLLKQGLSPDTDLMIMCPQKKGNLGVVTVNDTIKDFINPETDDEQTKAFSLKKQKKNQPGRRKGQEEEDTVNEGDYLKLTLHDLVMNLENNVDIGVMNGEIGTVKGFTHTPEYDADMQPTGKMLPAPIVEFNAKSIVFPPDKLKNLTVNNASTVHKNQGSENTVAIVILSNSSVRTCSKNLLFTGITRGKGHAYVVGSAESLMKAVNNVESITRYTGLKDKLVARIPKLIENLERLGAPTDYLEENIRIIAQMKEKEERALNQAKLGLNAPDWAIKATVRKAPTRTISAPRPTLARPGGGIRPVAPSRPSVGAPRPIVARPVARPMARPMATTRPSASSGTQPRPAQTETKNEEPKPGGPTVIPVRNMPVTSRPTVARPMARPVSRPISRPIARPAEASTHSIEENNVPRSAPPMVRATPTQRVAPAVPGRQHIEPVPKEEKPSSTQGSQNDKGDISPTHRQPPVIRRPVVRNIVVRPRPPGI